MPAINLTSNEQVVLKKIAATGSLHAQRARALLALDEGAAQTEVEERSGLSPGQVRYCLRRFQTVGLDMFPKDVLATGPIAVTPSAAVETASAEVTAEPTTPAETPAAEIQDEIQPPEPVVKTKKVEKSKAKKDKKKKKDKKAKGVKDKTKGKKGNKDKKKKKKGKKKKK